MSYGVLLILHLLAAIAFVGTVFFEVVMLEGVRKHLPQETMRVVERTIGNQATAVMPWVLLTLYAAGIGLAWQHRAALAQPLTSSFGLLLLLNGNSKPLSVGMRLKSASSNAIRPERQSVGPLPLNELLVRPRRKPPPLKSGGCNRSPIVSTLNAPGS